MVEVTPVLTIAAACLLMPYLGAAFWPARLRGAAGRLPVWLSMALPSLLCVPYAMVTLGAGNFSFQWLAVYALAPVGLAACARASLRDGLDWVLKIAALLVLGLAVDLRWFEAAWPPHLAVFNKVLLLDAGIYAFFLLRPIKGAGFDLRLRGSDMRIGLREFVFYLPIALALGLGTGFLHKHGLSKSAGQYALQFAEAWVFTFFFIAVPEELFFRGWLQNLLERRVGRIAALILTSVLFGLSHFNKRAEHFNARYVLMAAIAGIFYGRAWRAERRVGASAVSHATVDSVWSLFLR